MIIVLARESITLLCSCTHNIKMTMLSLFLVTPWLLIEQINLKLHLVLPIRFMVLNLMFLPCILSVTSLATSYVGITKQYNLMI